MQIYTSNRHLLPQERDYDLEIVFGVGPQYGQEGDTALSFAAASMGIALARMPGCDGLYQQLGLAPCLNDFSIPGAQHYYLTYPSSDGLSKAGKAFRTWLLTCAQESAQAI